MKKIILAFTIIAIMVMPLVGCGPKKEEGAFTFDVPEGFTKIEDFPKPEGTDETNLVVYMALEEYAGSSVGYDIYPYGGSILEGNTSEEMTEQMENQLENQFKQQGETNPDVKMIASKKYKIDGYTAFRFECEYKLQGTPMKAIQVMVETKDKVHCVTFTEVNNAGCYDVLLESADSIRFE